MRRRGDELILTDKEFMDMHSEAMNHGIRHAKPSPKTLKALNNFMENQDLIIQTIKELKTDLCERFDRYEKQNDEQHKAIMSRQDHTNGSVAKIKKSQLILWTATSTVFVILAILGLIPERLYEIVKGIT